ncbi:hypothetical protein [Spiroplasma diminutum]|uniref:Transmembrane protein n=1 Tax=Spiroplasma diminutum CUAS-1 TaxID=1276221 RepID=S5LVT7_9MOLU|nr:hypothetical protein [Spiroplasma diminutum]AGR41944.1 hypothetical protein SDIMI_v3c02400 [Spiroplasma diminutum CUAS-1]
MIEWYMIILELLGYIFLIFSSITLIWITFGYIIFFLNKNELKINFYFLAINLFIFVTLIIFTTFWLLTLKVPESLNGYDKSNEAAKILLAGMTIAFGIISIISFLLSFSLSRYFGFIKDEENNRKILFGKFYLRRNKRNIKKG